MLSPRPAYARFASFVGFKSAEAHSAKAETRSAKAEGAGRPRQRQARRPATQSQGSPPVRALTSHGAVPPRPAGATVPRLGRLDPETSRAGIARRADYKVAEPGVPFTPARGSKAVPVHQGRPCAPGLAFLGE